jgi:hypothetical protein
MTRAMLLAIGLMMAASTATGSTTGSIGVKLVIFSRCEINSNNGKPASRIDCGGHYSAQPRVTQSVIESQAKRQQKGRLVTIEW